LCVNRIENTDTLYVEYLDSLDRAYERLGAFEPKLRDSVALLERGMPLQPTAQVSNKPRPKSVDDLSELVGLGAEIEQTVGKKRAKAPAPVQRSAKRKAN
jgi:hypothetical protein